MAIDIEREGLNDSRGIFMDISWKAVPVHPCRKSSSIFYLLYTFLSLFDYFPIFSFFFCLLFFFSSRVEIVMVESFISLP